jgi:pyruvate formate lyase activating enzyme
VDCKFCQNWDLARRRPEEISSVTFSPEDVVEYAIRWKCQSISFTYNEPTVFNEFVQDVADAGRPRGIKQCIVSNGFISRQPLLDLSGRIDAYKVDLKSFSEDYYRDVVHGRLQPVLDTLITLKSRGIWTEIVYLTVPTLNDNTGEVKEMIRWILRELGPDVPIHFSKFYPRYKLRNLPPTPVETLERLRKVALDGGLHYVYIGNVPGHEGENTYCPGCGKLLIGRYAYQIFAYHVHGGKCEYCGESIAGLWS